MITTHPLLLKHLVRGILTQILNFCNVMRLKIQVMYMYNDTVRDLFIAEVGTLNMRIVEIGKNCTRILFQT